jgi:hypothetical protein
MKSPVASWALVLVAVGGLAAERKAMFSEQAKQHAQTLRQAIQAEIKTLGKHPWAGDYCGMDGVSVILAPQAGYVYELHCCLGPSDRDYGAVSWSNDRLRLSFTWRQNRKGLPVAEEMFPIAWGDRTYLIPAERIVDFCNRVNDGTEPRKTRWGLDLLRAGDEAKSAEGIPVVPDAFKPYLLSQPIEVKIVGVVGVTERTDVRGRRVNEFSLILNRGRKHGLLAGMRLYFVEPKLFLASVRITKAEDTHCEALMMPFDTKLEPRVGWWLTTRWKPPRKEKLPGTDSAPPKRFRTVY